MHLFSLPCPDLKHDNSSAAPFLFVNRSESGVERSQGKNDAKNIFVAGDAECDIRRANR